jgi:predicted ATPase
MGQLILENLEISKFRGFRHLRIDQLGRVNLIVGQNSIGKTSLLEALRLYASRGSPQLILSVLRSRNEITDVLYCAADMKRNPLRAAESEDWITLAIESEDRLRLACEQLFYGRKDLRESDKRLIQIGLIGSDENRLSIAFEWYIERNEPDRRSLQVIDRREDELIADMRPALTVQVGGSAKAILPIDEDDVLFRRRWAMPDIAPVKEIRCSSVPVDGLQNAQIGRLWDSIALTNLEDDVLKGLRIIAPEIERISIIGSLGNRSDRIVVVKMPNRERPISLRSLGDGMTRILGIILALVNAQDGLLLIDEIENGIHYSVQTALWRIMLDVAARLNVQVFATSHSWDCIEAFQKATQENAQEEGMLIRLERKMDDIRATLFDERRLAIAIREQIEVR